MQRYKQKKEFNDILLFCVKRNLVVMVSFSLTLSMYGQNLNAKVVISESQPTIERVIKSIEQQTEYRIARDGSFNALMRITLTNKENTVNELMELIAQVSGRPYTIIGKAITIKKNELVAPSIEETAVFFAPEETQSIYGTVQALDQCPLLKGAVVKIQGKVNRQTETNAIGYYAFEKIPAGRYTVTVEIPTYKKQQFEQLVQKAEAARVVFILQPTQKKEPPVFQNRLAFPKDSTNLKLEPIIDKTYVILPYQKPKTSTALKTNLVHDALLAVNLGVEFRINNRMTLDIPVTYKPFTINQTGGKEFRMLIVQPELRFWSHKPFNRSFWGVHALYAHYNVGGFDIGSLKNNRYQGDLYGVGVSYGYNWHVAPRWSLEATIGLGYAYLDQVHQDCENCVDRKGLKNSHQHYLGVTKAGISLIYLLK